MLRLFCGPAFISTVSTTLANRKTKQNIENMKTITKLKNSIKLQEKLIATFRSMSIGTEDMIETCEKTLEKLRAMLSIREQAALELK